jgi:hypothetical protein
MIRAASWPGPEAERMYARMYGVGVLRVRGLGPGLEFLGFGLELGQDVGAWGSPRLIWPRGAGTYRDA